MISGGGGGALPSFGPRAVHQVAAKPLLNLGARDFDVGCW